MEEKEPGKSRENPCSLCLLFQSPGVMGLLLLNTVSIHE